MYLVISWAATSFLTILTREAHSCVWWPESRLKKLHTRTLFYSKCSNKCAILTMNSCWCSSCRSFVRLAGWCHVLLSQTLPSKTNAYPCSLLLHIAFIFECSPFSAFDNCFAIAIQLRCVWNAPCHYAKANYTHRTEMLSHNNWILRQFANGIVYIQNASVVQSQSHFLKVRSWCDRCDSAT